jgi:hypothetical protein
MSLKSFHIVFVTISTLLFAFVTVWAFVLTPERSQTTDILGYVGIGGIVLMLVYGFYFLRKIRETGI